MTPDYKNQIEEYEDTIELLRGKITNLEYEQSDLEYNSDHYVTITKLTIFLSLISVFIPFVWILVILFVVSQIIEGYQRYKERKLYKKWINESYEQLRYYQNELRKLKFGKSISDD